MFLCDDLWNEICIHLDYNSLYHIIQLFNPKLNYRYLFENKFSKDFLFDDIIRYDIDLLYMELFHAATMLSEPIYYPAIEPVYKRVHTDKSIYHIANKYLSNHYSILFGKLVKVVGTLTKLGPDIMKNAAKFINENKIVY